LAGGKEQQDIGCYCQSCLSRERTFSDTGARLDVVMAIDSDSVNADLSNSGKVHPHGDNTTTLEIIRQENLTRSTS
jgi:hypothetical protein